MASTTITLTDDFLPEGHPLRDKELDFHVEANVSPYDPGNTYGPAENCYPPEGGDVEVLSFEPKADAKGIYPVDPEWANADLMKLLESNEKFREHVEEQLFESAESSRYDEGDYEYDRWKDEGRR